MLPSKLLRRAIRRNRASRLNPEHSSVARGHHDFLACRGRLVLTGVGPRVAEAPTIPGHPYLSPYEDLKLGPR